MGVMASLVSCFVGCNAGSPDQQALHVLECDVESGSVRLVQSVKGVQGTTYFQLGDGEKHLYTGIFEERGAGKVGSLVRFALDGGKIGAMECLTELPCEGPCHIALTADGKRVAFAAYLSGTVGTVGTDGKGLVTAVLPNDARGPNALRQQKAYAHQTFNLPNGKLGVMDLGCDRICFFDPITMTRDTALEIKADPGDGPRHALWSKEGKFLFVVNELSSTVASYAYSGASFTRLGKWTMLPEGWNRFEADGETLSTKAAALKLTADGKILMASNRGHDSIAFYAVQEDGTLRLKNIAKLTGAFPRDFALMPGEKFMVVGHKMSNEIQVYRFDRAACTLTPVGAPLSVWRPLCFVFKSV